MKEIKDLDELHHIVIEIAKKLHLICKNNDIEYYMLGGTMLGAIRHNGFIPWDDDMDFGVMRKDYYKLINLLKKGLPDYYKVRTIKDNVGIYGEIVKIEDTRTVIEEPDRKGYECGAFIDLFPLDYTNGKHGRWSKYTFISRLIYYQYHSQEKNNKDLNAKIVRALGHLFGKYFIIDSIKKLVSKKGTHIANICGMWGYKETVEKSIMGKPQLYAFEDTKFYGVANPDAYLRCLYGDYMELPPEGKRHFHITKMYYK
jgi:lipopolysaccharide cholinephosphotransferase